jgi:hypothetical protein
MSPLYQRQAERRKRDQQYKDRQRPRGDDAEPTVDPDVLFPVSQRFLLMFFVTFPRF